jgi:Tfp pilus assembly protein FimT
MELLITLMVTATVAAIGAPITGTALAEYRLSGDAHGLSNAVALAKMRAASDFSQARLYVDLVGLSYHIETWQKTGTPAWVAEGGSVSLSSRDTFGFSPLTTPPPASQSTIGQAPACTNASGTAIAGTACVVFNSRGIPVDSSGAPTGNDAVYVTGVDGIYGLVVAATGQVSAWRTTVSVQGTWQQQ